MGEGVSGSQAGGTLAIDNKTTTEDTESTEGERFGVGLSDSRGEDLGREEIGRLIGTMTFREHAVQLIFHS